MGATTRPHVGLTPVGARLDCRLSRRVVRAAAAAVQPVILASQSYSQQHTSTMIARPHDSLAVCVWQVVVVARISWVRPLDCTLV
eukprot:1833086-Prymnesium_polylepis.1